MHIYDRKTLTCDKVCGRIPQAHIWPCCL